MTTNEDLKARLLAPRPAADDTVELDGLGTVRVRALSRGEVFALHKITDNVEDFERKFLSIGMVEPALTENEVAAWQAIPGAAAEIQEVSDKIETLSGLKKGADKSGVSSS